MARQALRITTEATPGTYASGGTTAIIRLDHDNAFVERPKPNMFTVRDSGSSNRLVQTGYGTVALDAKLSTLFYPSQAAVLLPWGFNITAAGGGFKNATTVTIDYFDEMEDSGHTKFYQRYLGCYVDTAKLMANNSGEGVKARLDFGIKYLGVATITSSDFADPALATYPTDLPYIFQNTATYFSLGGTRTNYSSVELSVKNILDVIYDESVYPQAIKWCGRDVTGSADFRFKAATDRTTFGAVTSQVASLEFVSGAASATFDMKSSAYLSAVDDETPLGKAHRQKVSYASYLDIATGTDLVVTVV